MIRRLLTWWTLCGLRRDGLVHKVKGEWRLTPRGRLYAEDVLTAELIVLELTR